MNAAKRLIHEILDITKISKNELAAVISIERSTLTRILSGRTAGPSLKTYMKLIEHKSRIVKNRQPQ